MSTAAVTSFGFDWGPMKVERAAHIEGRGYVLMVKTEHARLEVFVTEAGRKIKTYPLPAPADAGEER